MFDRLIESTNERRSVRTWIFFAASSMTWSIVLAGVAVAGVLMADAKLDDDFDKLNLIAQVPPGPAAARTRNPEPAKPQDAPTAPTFVAIVRPAEHLLPPRPTIQTGPIVPNSVGDGDPNGTVIGDPGHPYGPGGGGDTDGGVPVPAPAPPRPVVESTQVPTTPPAPTRPKHIGVISGLATQRVEPPYPEIARAANIQGAVVVSVTVSEIGRVIEAHAVSGHPMLRQASIDAARRWQFTPTILNGIPTKVIGTITFNFKRT